jgi:hypothetical protein
MLALFPPERSDHAFVHAVWAWREGELSPKLTPAIEAVDVDRLRRVDRKIHDQLVLLPESVPPVFSDDCRRLAKWCIVAGRSPNSLVQELAPFLANLCRARVEIVSRRMSAVMGVQRSGGRSRTRLE